MLRLEFKRRQVVQAHVRSDGVVMPAPSLDDDPGFGAIAEPLDAQAFITEFAIEGFIGTVLPRLAGVDDGRVDAIIGKPFQDGVAHELWPAIRSQISRGPMVTDQAGKNLDDPRRTNTASDINLQAFVSEFIHDGQAFELLAVGTSIKDEIVGPDMVGSQRC